MWFPVGRRPLLATIIALLMMGTAPLAAPALVFDNQTLTGTVDLPIDQFHRFLNTITLDDATINVHGSLENFSGPDLDPVTVTGTGQVHIHGLEGNWNGGSYNPLLTIDTGIEVHVEGGTWEIPNVINRGTLLAYEGGVIDLGAYGSHSFTNEGMMRVDSGGLLRTGSNFYNQGEIVVENATAVLSAQSYGEGTFSITDSTIYASGTLSSLQAIDRVRSEIVIGSLDLGGETITIADVQNKRWAISWGSARNGTIQSEDGFELNIVGNPIGYGGGPSFRDIVLNADVRIATEHTVSIYEGVTGAGRLILEGGTLLFGGGGGRGTINSLTSEAVSLVEPDLSATGSVVEIYGAMDNTGRTIYLREGADWQLNVLQRRDGITGGRIEGDPGIELRATRRVSQGRSTGFDDLVGVTLAAPLRVVAPELSIRGGLQLDHGIVTIGEIDSGYSYISFREDQTLGGIGEIRFEALRSDGTEASPNQLNLFVVWENTLTVEEGITVRTWRGSGTFWLLRPSAVVINHGTLLAENGHTLHLFAGNSNDFQQYGTLRVTEGSILSASDEELFNQGRLEIAGGRMDFSGDLTQSSEATLSMELLASSAGAPSAIEVAGFFQLDGVLEVSYVGNDWSPVAGDSFLLGHAEGGITGNFANLSLSPLDEGLYWDLQIGPNTLILNVLATVPEPGSFILALIAGSGALLTGSRVPCSRRVAAWA